MAEIIVKVVINHLVTLLYQEAVLLEGVHKDILDIKDELESIASFLKDADARAEIGDNNNNNNNNNNNDGVKVWVKQVRDGAYRIEDVIDAYMLHMAQHQYPNRFIKFLRGVTRSGKKLKTRHQLALEVRDIKGSIKEIYDRSLRYGFNSSSAAAATQKGSRATWREQKAAFPFVEESQLVGIETPRDELISWLDKQVLERAVISVVGMGGMGKTTLAKIAFDKRTKTRGHFDCHAYVIVSPSYKNEDLLRIMMKQFYNTRGDLVPNELIDAMELSDLISKMREYLQELRYVVLLDDVWQIDFWKFFTHVLPNNCRGSRIIITTQNDNVASSSCGKHSFNYIYKMQPLLEKNASQLFRNKAFQSEFQGRCPPELEELSLCIVKKCEGLPLAIEAMGSLLSTKENDVSEWRKLHNNLGTELESNKHMGDIANILYLSYSDLPYYLKPCFLYFGIFPEDEFINCKRLIKLWIAEGFVEKMGNKTLEMVGEEYLTELVHRNLVQVKMVNFLGKVKRCRVHGILREIILIISHDLSFCQILAKDDSCIEERSRRLSIVYNKENATENITNSLIRSVFLFRMNTLQDTFLITFCANFKLLKLFDLQYAPIHFLPKEVGDLLNLRYLSIRGTKIETLPKSIGKLRNLVTLDFKFTRVQDLPIEISMLHKLQYLLSFYKNGEADPSFNSARGMQIHQGIGCLEALEKLYHVEANQGIDLINELGNLRKLRKLGITKLTTANCQALCSSIEKMIHLRSLDVYSLNQSEIIDLSSLASPPPFVQRINLCGRIVRLPDWIPQLQDLVILTLGWSGLIIDPLQSLQSLQNLQKLWLREAYDGDQLHFKAGWFQKLKVLGVTHLNGLKLLSIDNGAMPLLQELTLGPSPQLKEMPSGIQHLKNLTTLQFFDMPKEFVLRTLPDQGVDFCKVEHIPAVLFNRKIEGGGYNMYTLSSDSIEIKHSYE